MAPNTANLGKTVLTMTTVPVKAKTRRLSAKWTVEAQKDLGGPSHNPTWLWKHIDEIHDRLRYLTSGKYPSRWIDRDLTEAMALEITKEIDKEILESLRKLKEEDLL